MQVALELTERQQQDMMYLRRLLFSKLGQIYRDRKVVLNGMPTEGDGICCSSDKLGDMTQSAEELRNSGAEELTTYMQFSSAFYRGVGLLERLLPIVCLLVPAMANLMLAVDLLTITEACFGEVKMDHLLSWHLMLERRTVHEYSSLWS